MNARQKAKKYKKELERLRSIPFKPKIEYTKRNVVTIRVTTFEESSIYPIPEDIIIDDLCEKLSKSDIFREAVTIEREIMDDNGLKKHTATLQVLR